MKISVMVKPNSRKESVEEKDGVFLVRVNAPPTEGRANERVIELLAKHFHKSKSSFELISGQRGKKKIFKME